MVTDFVQVDGSECGEAPRCSICGYYTGLMPLLPPIRVELETWGKSYGDIAWGPCNELLFSDRFMEMYQKHSLVGLINIAPAEIVKVKSRRKLRQPVPNYYCCRSMQSRAVIDDIKSGLVRDEHWTCGECRTGGIIKRTKRVLLEAGSWSGEDIFYARGLPGTILVSEKFSALCREYKISNCLLIPAEKYSFDYYPWEKNPDEREPHGEDR